MTAAPQQLPLDFEPRRPHRPRHLRVVKPPPERSFATTYLAACDAANACVIDAFLDAANECAHGALPGDRPKPDGCTCWE
jgi:hypothetical protein